MTDISDRATEREEQNRADALAAQSKRSRFEGKTVNDSAKNCCVCETRIPLRRRQAIPGVQTCIDCQKEIELAAKKFGDGL